MSKRTRGATIVIFGSGLVAGAALIFFFGGGKNRATVSESNAADDKSAAPNHRYYLTEDSPKRTFTSGEKKDLEYAVYVSRQIFSTGKSIYRVHISDSMSIGHWILAPEDVSALVKMDKQLKGSRKTEAKAVSWAHVTWPNHDNSSGHDFYYHLGSGWNLGEQFIPSLENALKDVEVLKATKPSLNW